MKLNTEIVLNETFQNYIESFSKIFAISRIPENKANAKIIFEIQLSMWTILKSLESSMKEVKKELIEKWKECHLDVNFFAHKRLSRIARTIIDWIVWRNLWYKKAWLTILANNKRNILNNDFEWLLKEAKYFSDWFITIISDLTETVRIGDLLFIHKWSPPLITEAKEWKNKNSPLKLSNIVSFSSNRKQTKQFEKILDTQNILFSWKINRLWCEIVNSDFQLHRYFSKVEEWIQKSINEWYFIERLNKNMSIKIINMKSLKRMTEAKMKSISEKPKKLINYNNSSNILILSNLDTFHYSNNTFFKWITPYSIFPFSDEICIKLLTWELIIYSYLNIDGIINLYRNNWWIVEKSEEKIETIPIKVKNQSWLFWEDAIDDTFLTLRKWEYYQTIPFTDIMKIWLEFISIKSFILFSEYLYEKALLRKEKEKWIAMNFNNDKNIFN